MANWLMTAVHSIPRRQRIDELGYLPFEPDAAHLFFQLVSRRYERGSLLITSNRSVGEWGAVFGDAVVATAILDRLLHHSHVIPSAVTATACVRSVAPDCSRRGPVLNDEKGPVPGV